MAASSSSTSHFLLPDLHAACSFESAVSPYLADEGPASAAWIDGYNIFSDNKRAHFIHSFAELLVGHAYPYAGRKEFRLCCDFVNILFVLDELSDDEKSGDGVREVKALVLQVMKEQRTVDADHVLVRIMTEFRDTFFQGASKGCARRFLKLLDDYLDAVAREADLRAEGSILGLQDFTTLRREGSAAKACFGLFEYCLGLDLPLELFNDKNFIRAYNAAVDMVCIANDLYSYNLEQSKGHGRNNILEVLMNEGRQVDLQSAVDKAGTMWFSCMTEYLSAKPDLLTDFSSSIQGLRSFLNAMEFWVRGNLDWSFMTERYFGKGNQAIRTTRLVRLYPKEA